ncbi:lebercilin [Trichomycterus rosablanca]|uniref:lebercilin n=1 Tax=Trichomycterus rosablanca TaxID=2290929 RepID=UPI002F35534A
MMDSQTSLHIIEDMKELEQSPLSSHSDKKDSALSLPSGKSRDGESSSGNRARTKTRKPKRDPDQDQTSDGDHSSSSYYSDDYKNASLSDRSFSSRSPSPPRGGRMRRVSSSPSRTTRMLKGVSQRPGPRAPHPQRTSAPRSQSLGKDAPPKDLDFVTKRLLSARLLKISELKNTLSEQQLHTDELQRENRLLRQLQLRQEKALHRYNDTESEISQLISRHNNETHTLRERLRRSQEKERAAERRCKEADAQLQRCRDQLHKLQQLANEKQLGERDELRRNLMHTQLKAQEHEHRVKELEKNLELSTGSFQRQMANERKKTHDALQDVQVLREEVERLSAKLKERERELDTRNIYANRMLRGASRKELEDVTKRKVLSASGRSSSKAVQTEDTALRLEFPSPPLAITDGTEFTSDDHADDYLTLKELQSSELEMEREREKARAREREMERAFYLEKERNREQERLGEMKKKIEKEKVTTSVSDKFSSNHNTGTRKRDEWDREDEDRKKQIQQQNEEKKQKEEEQMLREQEILVNQVQAEEQRRRKEQLLTKMREIDMQAQDSGSTGSPPHVSELQNKSPSIFSFTEPHEYVSTPVVGKRGGAVKPQNTSQDLDLTFGSYAPSFGKPAPRAGLGPRTSGQTVSPFTGNGDAGMDENGLVKEKKSLLMQQLFGSTASSPPSDQLSKSELLSSSSTKPASGGLGGRRRDTETPARLNSHSKPTLHSHKDLGLKAITSFDEDIEELG